MSSRSAVRPSLGLQFPRVESHPDYDRSLGAEFIEIAELAGLHADPWQRHVIEHSMGITTAGKLATPQVVVVVPRQNGKGGILEIMELGRLFVLGSPLTIHSAHLYKTSMEAFLRIKALIQRTPELDRQVKKYSNTNGDEGIELKDGSRLQFAARTKGSGRGWSAECVALDEAMYLPPAVMSALVPTGSAKEERQIWYLGSAVDQVSMADGETLARLRNQGIAGTNEQLAYFEWSVDAANPDEITDSVADDPENWAVSNPAYGIRISEDAIKLDKSALGLRGFAVERLNVGDWPDVDGLDGLFDMEKWQTLTDPGSQITGKVRFAFDVAPSRAVASISVSGRRKDGLVHVEMVRKDAGTGWIVDKLADLKQKHKPAAIICDELGPGASLIPELESRGVKVETVNGSEYAKACGAYFDAFEQSQIRHLGQPELTNAHKSAITRPLGDRWAWDRKKAQADITPLVSSTLAAWHAMTQANKQILVGYA